MSANPDDKLPMAMELKPCPFCGGQPTFVPLSEWGDAGLLQCENDACGVRPRGCAHDDLPTAIAAWNTRVEPSPSAERMREALTPSGETKAAYIGEFTFTIDSDGDSARRVTVPWTTIKEIMAAIRTRALTNHSTQGDGK